MVTHHCMTLPCMVCTGQGMAAAVSTASWNGPVCQICGTHYLGAHECSTKDILRRVRELLALLPEADNYGVWRRADPDGTDW